MVWMYVSPNSSVFPASAGMILKTARVAGRTASVPRIRGDDPYGNYLRVAPGACSPHPRG